MARFLVVFVVLVSLAALAFAGTGIKDGSISAYSNGTNIIVRWISDDESGLLGYELGRRVIGAQTFVPLVSPYIPAKGNGASYDFLDNSAFRTDDNVYQYQITPVYADHRSVTPYLVSVRHNVSSVRRTWGSIKAMFR
jgi:hypothetical protein